MILLIKKIINFQKKQKKIMNYMDQLKQKKFQKLLKNEKIEIKPSQIDLIKKLQNWIL